MARKRSRYENCTCRHSPPDWSCRFVLGNNTGTSKVSFAEEDEESSTERQRMAANRFASSTRLGQARSSTSSVYPRPRRLASIETAATSAVGVGSIQFAVNGRPSDAVQGGVTNVRLTSTDDGSVRIDQTCWGGGIARRKPCGNFSDCD